MAQGYCTRLEMWENQVSPDTTSPLGKKFLLSKEEKQKSWPARASRFESWLGR
ncbi:MAG: hypothetical protein WD876_03330 [Candidatus Pacearchaeota archaeon]